MKSQLIPYTNIITYQQGYSDQLLLPGLHTYLLEIPHFPEKKIYAFNATLLTTTCISNLYFNTLT